MSSLWLGALKKMGSLVFKTKQVSYFGTRCRSPFAASGTENRILLDLSHIIMRFHKGSLSEEGRILIQPR